MRRLMVLVGMIGGVGAAQAAPCVATARDAVKAYESGAAVGVASAEGYRVVGARRDDVLPILWALVERCGHPEWPALRVAMEVRGGEQTAAVAGQRTVEAAVVVVRAGETVRVWRQDRTSRLEMAAVSEQSGAVGARIRLRALRSGLDGEPIRYVFGLVRGPADVEME